MRNAIDGIDLLFGPLLLAWLRQRNAGAILLYHRVAPDHDPAYPPCPPQLFREHCAFLKARFHILPLAEFVDRHRRGKSLRRCCAITFDDGYRDFLAHAYPILREHAAPATHFLVGDCVTSGLPNWNLRLNRILHCLHGQKESGHATDWGDADVTMLAPKSQSEATIELGLLSAEERSAWMEKMERVVTGLFGPLPLPPPMLGADDLKLCDGNLIEWGSHTLSHAMLDNSDPEELQRELKESRERLESLSASTIRFVSYPNGAYSPAVVTASRECGYEAAFAVDQRAVSPHSPLFALPRFDIAQTSRGTLRLELSGAMQTVRRLRGTVRGGAHQ